MARRRRLHLPGNEAAAAPETKSAIPSPRIRMPIAEIAGDAAGHAALEEVSRALTDAEAEGRMVRRIEIAAIDRQHINRDRMVFDEDEMAALVSSIDARGQQMPVEVMRTGSRFALISGARRIEALRRLGATEVLAFVRRPASSVEAHVAMVEENEIRAPLSLYERANLAVVSVNAGVFPTPARAISTLFQRATSAKRWKIGRFVILREKLGWTLLFPAAIPEKLGLRLADALEADKAFAARLGAALRKAPPADAAAERRVIERALKPGSRRAAAPAEEIAPGIALSAKAGRAVLSGAAVDAGFLDALRDWAISRAKENPSSD